MRFLTVGNLYPPQHLGGYELVWQGAVRALRAAGHEVSVLTNDSRFGDRPEEDEGVSRTLRWYWHDHRFPDRSARERLALERHNASVFAAAQGGVDAIGWFHMGGMSLSLLGQARAPSAAFVHDDWVAYGPRVDGWLRGWSRAPAPARRLGAAVSRIPTRFAPTAVGEWLFVSDFIRRRAEEAAGALPGAGVLHSGIDRSFVAAAPERPWAWRLLCVGRIDARKGVDTAIDALARLPEEATLTVVGEGDEEHLAALRTRAAPFGDRVMFVGARPRAELPAIFAKHDAVLFPVRWEEPWGLVPLEAMGTGRPVVATAGGGSVEYLRDGENAIVAPADDAEAFAAAVRRLAGDPAERARLRDGGSITAREHTADRFEAGVVAALERAAGRRG